MEISAISIEVKFLAEERKRPESKIHQCPKCKVELTHSVYRGALIKALLPDNVKRYLCTGCLHKYNVIA